MLCSDYGFDPAAAFEQIKTQQLEWMNKIGAKKVILGVSGGKDSSVILKLEAKILGPENVYGVMMPNGLQKDISDSMQAIREAGIDANGRHNSFAVDISNSVKALIDQLHMNGVHESDDTRINLPPRIRMSTLFALAQTLNAVVLNTDNLDEIILGYYSIFGDGAGSYGPIRNLTVSEVIELGKWLGLPDGLVYKKPGDGLQALGDEDRLGLKYADLDVLIRTGIGTDELKNNVMNRFKRNKFKTDIVCIPAPTFDYPNFII